MNFLGTDHISTIELVQHETCSIEIQCDLLAVAPLQKFPKGSATATIEYAIGNEEGEFVKIILTTGILLCKLVFH